MYFDRIPDALIQKADRCLDDHACLKGEKNLPRCRVTDADGEDILYLSNHGAPDCPYRILFGGVAICRCPVHYRTYTEGRKERKE